MFRLGACLHVLIDCSGDSRREASREQSDGEASPESRKMSLGRHRDSTLAREVQQNVTGLSLECHWFVVRGECGWTRFERYSDLPIGMSRPLAAERCSAIRSLHSSGFRCIWGSMPFSGRGQNQHKPFILWCPEGDLNPHDRLRSADFKSAVSADFTIRALRCASCTSSYARTEVRACTLDNFIAPSRFTYQRALHLILV